MDKDTYKRLKDMKEKTEEMEKQLRKMKEILEEEEERAFDEVQNFISRVHLALHMPHTTVKRWGVFSNKNGEEIMWVDAKYSSADPTLQYTFPAKLIYEYYGQSNEEKQKAAIGEAVAFFIKDERRKKIEGVEREMEKKIISRMGELNRELIDLRQQLDILYHAKEASE